MKTATISVLVFYTGLVAFFNSNTVEEAALHVKSDCLAQIEEQVTVSFYNHTTQPEFSDSILNPVQKKYRIFFENRSSKKLEVSIRYKDIDGNWIIQQAKTLSPGEEKEMGISYDKTYFYHASAKKGLNKKVLAGKYKTGLHEDAMSRLGFTKKDIWECYSTDTCNAFAVFE